MIHRITTLLCLGFASLLCAAPACCEPSTDDLNLGAMIQPVSEDNILYEPDYYNWGSSIIKGDDGKYHLFYAQMKKVLEKTIYKTDGTLLTAGRLERPFIYLEDGEPKVMTVAIREKSGESYSVFIPLQ